MLIGHSHSPYPLKTFISLNKTWPVLIQHYTAPVSMHACKSSLCIDIRKYKIGPEDKVNLSSNKAKLNIAKKVNIKLCSISQNMFKGWISI